MVFVASHNVVYDVEAARENHLNFLDFIVSYLVLPF